MFYHRVLASLAAPFLLLSAVSAQLGDGARHVDPAELTDRCIVLIDAFDEAVKSVPESDDVAAARKLRRSAAEECFGQYAPYIVESAIEDLRAALRMIGVAAETDRCEPRLAISPPSGLDCP
jgi:hypothetical protein